MRITLSAPCSLVWVISLSLFTLFPHAAFANAASDPGLWSQFIAWVYTEQRAFHRELTEALRFLRDGGGLAAASTLIVASFLYGVFHAAGPGHGKVVMTTYLATQPEQFKRGLILSVAAALCQGLSAILIVYGLVYLAGWLPRDTNLAVTWGERASFTLVAVLGLWLICRACRSLWARTTSRSDNHHEHIHHHHGCGGKHAPGCGHTHAVGAAELKTATSLRASASVVLSIGLRPCTGAILVLVFAQVAGLELAGLAAVLAMSLGTALAVSSLAMLTIGAREWAVHLIDRLDARETRSKGFQTAIVYSGDLIGLLGGALITFFGISLVLSSLQPAHPLGL